jgi:hypothetical protein
MLRAGESQQATSGFLSGGSEKRSTCGCLRIMVSRDYTEELGMAPRTKRVPLPIAIAIIALIGAGIWYGVSRSLEHTPLSGEKAEAAAAEKTAPGK